MLCLGSRFSKGSDLANSILSRYRLPCVARLLAMASVAKCLAKLASAATVLEVQSAWALAAVSIERSALGASGGADRVCLCIPQHHDQDDSRASMHPGWGFVAPGHVREALRGHVREALRAFTGGVSPWHWKKN